MVDRRFGGTRSGARRAGFFRLRRPRSAMRLPWSTVVAAVRSFAAYVLVAVYVAVTAPVGMTIALIVRHPGVLYRFGRLGVRIGLATVGIRYRVAGVEHVEGRRASVYCVNHTSNLEPPIVYLALRAAHPKLRILYKAELQKLPLLPAAFGVAGFVPIDRRNRKQSRAAIDAAAAALREGFSFLVFPEGTRSRSGDLLPFKKGGFVMAIRGGAAVVPLTILGAGDAMRRGSPIIRPVTVSVRIGPPIEPRRSGVVRRVELMARTRSTMEALLAAGPIR